jgi:polysaccharide pyruvyl transferase WcaK-like protein
MRAMLCGWFGSDNWGDELLLSTSAALLQEATSPCEITVMCARPGRVEQLHELPALEFPTFRPFRGLPRRWLAAMAAIRRTDVVILGPGTIFQERSHTLRSPGTLPLLLRVLLFSFVLRTPVVIFGAAVREGGSRAGNFALRLGALLCKSVWVRDAASAAILGGKAVAIGDVALAATIDNPPSNQSLVPAKLGVVFSVRPVREPEAAHLATVIHACATDLAASGLTSSFVAMALGLGARDESDVAVHRANFADWPLVPTVDLQDATYADMQREIFAAVGSAQIVVAMRLHAAVIAVLLGVPVVAIAYEQKVRATMEQLGQGRWVVDPDVSAAELSRLVHLRLDASDASDVGVEKAKHYAHLARNAVEEIARQWP